ncbi:MAG TPA: hypothetical protein VGX03_18065 [Candidatus Binatia bacterium]|jgi:hypothetical protein|nr:hypothetical protein [Candidatus Binatia bacterium]
MRRGLNLLVALFLFAVVGAGCASNTRTVRTETSTYPTGRPTVVEKGTTVTTTETREGSGGILSGTVNVIGEIIALPFRVVGALIGAIF